jgi:hypothetical protein
MKAFDTVPHRRLLGKIRSLGIEPQTLEWLSDFLVGRRQRVRVNGAFSPWTTVTSGIPQGSVLGPVMFIMYINDLPMAVNSNMYLFADDTKLFREIISGMDRALLQDDINGMVRWSLIWLLRFHLGKTKHLTIGSRDEDPDSLYTMPEPNSGDRIPIEKIETEKDLGVHIDKRLNFNHHITTAVNKAHRISAVIRRAFRFLDPKTFCILYKALVRPHLEYAQPVWHPHKRGHIDKLEAVQRRATRQVPSLGNLSYPDRLRRLKLPTLAYRRLRGDMIETYKLTHNIYDPDTDRPLFTYSTTTQTRGHSLKLQRSTCSRDTRRHFFAHRIISNWNALPENVVTAPSLHSFENRLDRHWTNHPLRHNPNAPIAPNHPYAQRRRTELDIEVPDLRPEPS